MVRILNQFMNNALKYGYCIGFFESWNLESTEAVIEGSGRSELTRHNRD